MKLRELAVAPKRSITYAFKHIKNLLLLLLEIGIWAFGLRCRSWGWNLGLMAGIWAQGLGVRPWVLNLGVEAEIWALN